MITIISQPNTYALAGNEMIIEVKATDDEGMPFYQYGPRAELKTVGANGLPDSEIVTVNWMEPDGATYAANFGTSDPVTEDYHLPVYNAIDFPTILSYWEAVAAKIQVHKYVSPFFDVYATQNGDSTYSLWVRVREYEEGWDIGFGGTQTNWAPIKHTDLITNLPNEYLLKGSFFLEADYQQGNYFLIGGTEGVPGPDSKLKINISDIIQKAGESTLPALPIPSWDQAVPYLSPTLKQYYFRIAESSADDGHIDSLVADEKVAILGGIANSLHAQNPFFITSLDATNSWLTWRPDNQKIGPLQPYYLSWYSYSDFAALNVSVYLELEVTDGDGAITSYLFDDQNISTAPGEIVVFPVGPEVLGIASDAIFYRVRIVGELVDETVQELSTWRSFFMDRCYYESERYITYLNSFFCPEVLRCVGIVDQDFDVEKEESVAVVPKDYAAYFQEYLHVNVSWREIFTYYTGHLTKKEALSLKELLISRYVYEISPERYIPLQIVGKEYPVTSTKQNLHSYAIEAYPAISDQFYRPVDADEPDPDVNVWGSSDGNSIWSSPISIPWG